jgi:hypothetical protein
MVNDYVAEFIIKGKTVRVEYHCNGGLEIEFPVQDEAQTYTAAEQAALQRFRMAFVGLVQAFGPENVDSLEINRQ